ncbi:MAG: TIM barrel protein [archaeon]
MGDATSYESFYGGGVSSLSPDYGNFVGYRMSAAALGFPGSPQTANQLGEAVNALKQGVKAFEVSMLVPETTEIIPKQHFEEMRALMKLSGVKPSVHGPVLDAAGFGEKGWGGEDGRADNERRMFDAIEKAHVLEPKGNVPIVFHSSNGAPGAEWRPGEEKFGEDKFVMEKGAVVNRETGQTVAIKREYKFRPEVPESLTKSIRRVNGQTVASDKGPIGVLFEAEKSVGSINSGEWENKLTEVAQMNKHAEEIIGSAPLMLGEYNNAFISEDGREIIKLDDNKRSFKGVPYFDTSVDENGNVVSGQAASYNKIRKAGLFLENADLAFKGVFHNAYKYGDDEQREKLKKLSENYAKEIRATEEVEEINGKKYFGIWAPIGRQKVLDKYVDELRKLTDRDLGGKTPEIYQESTKFAMDEASKTFGNLAMKSYEKFGGSAPVIAVENMFQGFAFSRAEDLKPLVEKSREKFVEQLIEKKGMSRKEAEKIAEKHLGVTWDVGHLNLLRKKGFSEKDIIEETRKIAPMVKHVHLTDNFGFADSHLPPGMGNVPIKGILEELEKTGKLGEMRKIVEAGAFVQHFKKSPHPWTMAALGSPIYGMKNAPYWNQVMDVGGSYFGGYGTINPQTHHAYFGAGFTTMPVELGGQMPGGTSRFGDTPMA